MQVFIISSICILNLLLWLLFFVKFKKLFSSDSEIEKAREQFDLLVRDLNNQTLSNINLIDLKIESLKEAIDLADKKLGLIHQEDFYKNSKTAISSTQKKRTPASNIIDENSAYEVNIKKTKRTKKQKDLFDEEDEKLKPQVHYYDKSGNVTAEVPLVNSNIYMSDNPIKKKSLEETVSEYLANDLTVDQIARLLNKSTTEIQFVIDMM